MLFFLLVFSAARIVFFCSQRIYGLIAVVEVGCFVIFVFPKFLCFFSSLVSCFAAGIFDCTKFAFCFYLVITSFKRYLIIMMIRFPKIE